MLVPLITQLLRLVGRLGPVSRFIHISRVVVANPTDRHKSVRNRCVIEDLVAFLCCHFAFFLNFLLVKRIVEAFVIGLSRISSLFSSTCYKCS